MRLVGWSLSMLHVFLRNKNLTKSGKSTSKDPPFIVPSNDEEGIVGGYNKEDEEENEPFNTNASINPFEPEPGNPYDNVKVQSYSKVSNDDHYSNPFHHPQMQEQDFIYEPGMYSNDPKC